MTLCYVTTASVWNKGGVSSNEGCRRWGKLLPQREKERRGKHEGADGLLELSKLSSSPSWSCVGLGGQ